MSIWNKILVGFIFVASVAFFYMAARTLKTHQYWRDLARRHEKKIAAVEKDNRVLTDGEGEGDQATPGIKQLRAQLHHMLINRGRVWYNCSPGQVNPQTGQVAVTTDQPDPHGIADKTVLYVFGEADVAQQGSYLGEFKVTGVDAKQVVLEPSMKMKPGSRQLQRLVAGKGPWSLYEIMPIDSRDTFASMDEKQLEQLLPQGSVAKYLKDGQTVTTDDMEELGLPGKVVAVDENGEIIYEDENGEAVKLVASGDGSARFVDGSGREVDMKEVSEKEVTDGTGRYIRPLRDYQILFENFHLQQSLLIDQIEAAKRDNDYIDRAVADARIQVQVRQAKKAGLQSALADGRRQHDAVDALRDRLQQEIDTYQDAVSRIIAANQAAASLIQRHQAEAAARIEARTRRMAQSGAGAN